MIAAQPDAIGVDSKGPRAWLFRGVARRAKGEDEAADAGYEQAKRLDPTIGD